MDTIWPPSASIASLDLSEFDVFAICSSQFWAHRQALVLGFFEQLRRQRTRGLLIGRAREVCTGAVARQIPCVVSRNFTAKRDPMGMMERWVVLQHFLAQRHRVVFAGVDVRFTLPAQAMLAAVEAAGVDGAFESKVNLKHGRVHAFTPDVIAALPTSSMAAFVDAVLLRFHEPLYAMLPPDLRVPAIRQHPTRLKGPAQQDMLYDTLLSTLYGRPMAMRKTLVARNFLCCWSKYRMKQSTSAQRGREAVRRFAGASVDAEACTCSRNVDTAHEEVALAQLSKLSMTPHTYGVVVSTPLLRWLATNEKLVVSMFDPCAVCHKWNASLVHALHCQGKSPRCLNLANCECLADVYM